ncbi:MAG TPA: metalloregulator ArsR/SmtB family transcription factor [Myxococcota bacterium]|nr:metalloregulator ArsR/SmtB family transcription factor [Myxococcota bacterium]
MADFNDTDRELATLAAALGAPARAHLIRVLVRKGPRTVKELVAEVPLAQATVSQHLAVLRDAGLVTARREGATTVHQIDVPTLRRLGSMIGSLALSAAPGR